MMAFPTRIRSTTHIQEERLPHQFCNTRFTERRSERHARGPLRAAREDGGGCGPEAAGFGAGQRDAGATSTLENPPAVELGLGPGGGPSLRPGMPTSSPDPG